MTRACTIATTGTIYSLTDPRTDEVRYIGQTVQPLGVRLNGHLFSPVMRVRLWVNELQRTGLAPVIAPVLEDVPLDELNAAERGEITRLLIDGAELLNESATADGRRILEMVRDAERKVDERAAWRELAAIAIATLGGPVPPGGVPGMKIPDAVWNYMAEIKPGHCEYIRSLLTDRDAVLGERPAGFEERLARHTGLRRLEDAAAKQMIEAAARPFSCVSNAAAGDMDTRMERHFAYVAKRHFDSRENAERLLTLTVWYMVAVLPWRHLAELAELPLDDASFIAWTGKDSGTREALLFLASCGDNTIRRLSSLPVPDVGPGDRPGRMLAAVVAAHTGTPVPEVIRLPISGTLADLARSNMLTQPMADLYCEMSPRALDDAFGKDIAPGLDADLGLPPGTSGRVLRAAAVALRCSTRDQMQRVADRSAGTFPVRALPDFMGWSGPSVIAAWSISACMVRAGLPAPPDVTAAEYLDRLRDLWTPGSWG